MPCVHGLCEDNSWRLVAQLRRLSAKTRILLLCDDYSQRMLIGCIQRGVSGCLLASSDPSLCAKALVAVHQGEAWFARKELLQALLTVREREILDLVGGALSNKEIARKLKISDKTVKRHLHHIYVKLQRSGRYKGS